MNLRDALENDIEFIASVCLDSEMIYHAFMPDAFNRQADKFLKEGLPRNIKIRIIEVGKEKIGFVGFLDISEDIRYMVALYIHSKYRRLGYGTKVVALLNTELTILNFREHILLVHKKASWAIDFYTKQGFKKIASSLDEVNLYNDMFGQYYIANTYLMSIKI